MSSALSLNLISDDYVVDDTYILWYTWLFITLLIGGGDISDAHH